MSRWKCVAALLLILLLGAGLRFYRITELEPAIWDEGVYLLEARYLSTFCTGVWESARLLLEEKRTGKDVWKKGKQLPGWGNSHPSVDRFRSRYNIPLPLMRLSEV